MKKEEILEMSRKENQNKDAYEIEVESRGSKLAGIMMLILSTVYYCYEIIIGKGENYSFYSLIALYCAVLFGYKAIKLEKRRKLYIFCFITWTLVTILTIIEYFA